MHAILMNISPFDRDRFNSVKSPLIILSLQNACEITIDSYGMFSMCHIYNIYCIGSEKEQ